MASALGSGAEGCRKVDVRALPIFLGVKCCCSVEKAGRACLVVSSLGAGLGADTVPDLRIVAVGSAEVVVSCFVRTVAARRREDPSRVEFPLPVLACSLGLSGGALIEALRPRNMDFGRSLVVVVVAVGVPGVVPVDCVRK